MKPKIVSFGEILMRLTPPEYFKLGQTPGCNVFFGGSEANVAAALAIYGLRSVYVTKIPDNAFGHAAFNSLRTYGVDTSQIKWGGNRLGNYLLEKGAKPCSGKCTYDRTGSSMQQALPTDFNWNKILQDADWFHFSGITPALSPTMFRICLQACKAAKRKGIRISCDINYRSKLWPETEAATAMQNLCQYADVLFINEQEAKILGIDASGEDLMEVSVFDSMVETLRQKYPASVIASAARIPAAGGELAIKAVLWNQQSFQSALYPIKDIDSVGAGDALAAALIYALLRKMDNQQAINFAAAAGALKHSCRGDFNLSPIEEIQNMVNAASGSGIQR